jgi:tetratricopeptide (TPR) repeat protein
LSGYPYNSFVFELGKIFGGKQTFPAVEHWGDTGAKLASGLPEAMDYAIAVAAKGRREGEETYSVLEGLPDEVRLYAAGAASWRRANAICPVLRDDWESRHRTLPRCITIDEASLDAAELYFSRVLALPEHDAKLRGVWAAYMLGEVHSSRAAIHIGKTEFTADRTAAVKAFEDVRRRALAGAADVQGLASASLGAQARLHLYTAAGPCDWLMLRRREACVAALAPHDIAQAVALYAEQAAGGSVKAANSAATIARAVLHNPDLTRAVVKDPVAQRALTAYVLSVVSPIEEDDKEDPRITNYLTAIRGVPIADTVSRGMLAALFYRTGAFVEAEEQVRAADGPMAHWVRAKLAMRKGETVIALAEYGRALENRPADISMSNTRRIEGERAILTLSRGDYMEAMTQLYAVASLDDADVAVTAEQGWESTSGIWGTAGETSAGDLALYMAERVLTIGELVDFLGTRKGTTTNAVSRPSAGYVHLTLDDNLRWLLARRLFRAKRFAEAIPYFPERIGSTEDPKEPRAMARDYIAKLEGLDAWTDPANRAEALFGIAEMERTSGMELFGYHGAPDFATGDGDWAAPDALWGTRSDASLVSSIEAERFRDSAPEQTNRFHYRYLAADRAVSAAALLPPTSQAHGALLCAAARWMRDGPPDHVEQDRLNGKPGEGARRIARYASLYAEATRTPISRLRSFGIRCERPDFVEGAVAAPAPAGAL